MIMKRTLVFLSLSLLLAIATLAQNFGWTRAREATACDQGKYAQAECHHTKSK